MYFLLLPRDGAGSIDAILLESSLILWYPGTCCTGTGTGRRCKVLANKNWLMPAIYHRIIALPNVTVTNCWL